MPPIANTVDPRLTSTVATGTNAMATVADPCLVSAAALIVALPGLIAVTVPDDVTVAIAELLVVHATDRPVSVFPFASFSVADACAV